MLTAAGHNDQAIKLPGLISLDETESQPENSEISRIPSRVHILSSPTSKYAT